MSTFAQGLARALHALADDGEREPPVALLWPDPEGQWERAFAPLRASLAREGIALYQHATGDGSFAPDEGRGPSIWLRCLLDASLPGASPPNGSLPVLLLPGIGSRDLKSPLTLRQELQPLVELQYRGDIFRHRRQARDWTVATFLRSKEEGLGLDVAVDPHTDEAAARALLGLLDAQLEQFHGRTLTAADFNRLKIADEVRDLLEWIGDPDGKRRRLGDNWRAFRDLIHTGFKLDLESPGAPQKAVERLIGRQGAWSRAWSYLGGVPRNFDKTCERIRALGTPAQGSLGLEEGDPLVYPHDNETAERVLAQELGNVSGLPPKEAAEQLIRLEERHRARRDSLWSRRGESPLAMAMEPLARLAAAVGTPLAGDDLASLTASYLTDGTQADGALIDTLAEANVHEDLVGRAARTVYLPWLDDAVRRFRAAWEAAGAGARSPPIVPEPGTCLIFVDGLRFDIARRVVEHLNERGQLPAQGWRYAPVPTVTATAKPAVTPVADACGREGKLDDFLPLESSTGQPARTEILRRAMLARGVQILTDREVAPPASATAIGWTECGNLDSDGHHMGLRLARQVGIEVSRIVERVMALRAAGWPLVRIVTDHGWLLVPGGLGKIELPKSVTLTAWSRAAIVSPGAAPELPTLPWFWADHVRIAVPPGAQAFRAGEVYAHGGVSPQECVIPDILVGGASPRTAAGIAKIVWRRLRLTVTLAGETACHTVELRRQPRDPATRVAADQLPGDGREVRLSVTDDGIDENDAVHVVLLDPHGNVRADVATRVGERS